MEYDDRLGLAETRREERVKYRTNLRIVLVTMLESLWVSKITPLGDHIKYPNFTLMHEYCDAPFNSERVPRRSHNITGAGSCRIDMHRYLRTASTSDAHSGGGAYRPPVKLHATNNTKLFSDYHRCLLSDGKSS